MSVEEMSTLAACATEHREMCLEVRAAYPPTHTNGLRPSFRDVVVILASSRGGSSLLFDILRSTGEFLALPGEHSTLYKLHGLGLPGDPQAHDGTVAGGDRAAFVESLRRDVAPGRAGHRVGRLSDPESVAGNVLRTLAQQWPGCPIGIPEAWDVIYRAICTEPPHEAFGDEQLLLRIIKDLRVRGWHIDPGYYDIAPDLVRAAFPGLEPPSGPPTPDAMTLEAPPFIVPTSGQVLTERDVDRPLLLKASVDAYRVRLLPELFPEARLRFIHLTRNPAAAVNGLIDGWLDRGFFSHNLADRARLDIAGYTERGSWGSGWWNFDLPPRWPDLVDQPLAAVCAGQWLGAHDAITAGLEGIGATALRVRAEDVIDADRRPATIARILHDLRDCGVSPAVLPESRVVMATKPPFPGRWRQRQQLLTPVLGDPVIRAASTRLGYGPEADGEWR